jgi:ABC-type polysaccharide/polyol phosphate export permease
MSTSSGNGCDLARVLMWRELTVRYKRSWLGIAWALAEPLVNVAVYALVFGFVLGARDSVESYPLFVCFGVLPWIFFSSTVDSASGVLLDNAALVRKIAFQRELLVVSVVIARLSTLFAGLVLAFAWAAVWSARGAELHWQSAPLVALGCLLLTMLTLGMGLAASSLQVVLGDTAFLIRFTLRLAFYACPIIYPLSRVPEAVRTVYELNPLVGILGCFNSIAANDPMPTATALIAATFGSVAVLVAGHLFFVRTQRTVSDLL